METIKNKLQKAHFGTSEPPPSPPRLLMNTFTAVIEICVCKKKKNTFGYCAQKLRSWPVG